MVYFEDNEILIRDMIQSDAPIITNEEISRSLVSVVHNDACDVRNAHGDDAASRPYKKRCVKTMRNVTIAVFTAFMVIGRIVSGVH